MKTGNLFFFMMLYIIGGMRKWRLKTLRHYEEVANRNMWLDRIEQVILKNYMLAVQIAKTYRLKKGYGDTYARGTSKFKNINEFALEFQDHLQIHEYVEYLINIALENHDINTLEKEIEKMRIILLKKEKKKQV